MANRGTAPAARQRKMDISVVVPVYNEEGALPELYPALADTLDRLPQGPRSSLPMTARATARRLPSTPLPAAIRGFGCCICRAIMARLLP